MEWAGSGRIERRTAIDDIDGQVAALHNGFQREGVARAAGSRGEDVFIWSRVSGDPVGPVPRYLPDLPGSSRFGDGELADGTVSLRPMEVADAPEVCPIRASPGVVAFTMSARTPTLTDVVQQCALSRADWLIGKRMRLVVRDAATGEVAGSIGLQVESPSTDQAEIDYYLAPAWRGRGYATRAVDLLCTWAFGSTALVRIVAGVHVTNTASQRVLERCGFRREGHERHRLPDGRGGRVDLYTYACLRQP